MTILQWFRRGPDTGRSVPGPRVGKREEESYDVVVSIPQSPTRLSRERDLILKNPIPSGVKGFLKHP